MMTSSEMWPKVELQIDSAINIVKDNLVSAALFEEDDIVAVLEARYKAGSLEHNDEWYEWEMPVFWENIKEEIFDMVLYTAMNRVRAEEARKYGQPDKTSLNDSWAYRASLGTCSDANTTVTDDTA